MTDPAFQRKLRQRIQTERLLGADSVPVHAVDPARLAAAPGGVGTEGTERTATTARTQETPETPETPSSKSQIPNPKSPIPSGPRIDRQAKLAILSAMDEKEVRPCQKCELCRRRIQTVFGEGDPDAQVMFIGEGPGQTEDEQGRPFVGRAGELLNKMIVAMGLQREQVYIANVVKCRPPDNRTPTPTEVDACWDYLLRQIETIQPRVLVTLGGPATKKLCQTDRGITSIRGTWQTFTTSPGAAPTPLMPTFHPAYLLRSYTVENRRKVWSDLQKVMEMVGKSQIPNPKSE